MRIQLAQRRADDEIDETIDAGALIISDNQANNFVNGLTGSLKNLDEKLRAHRQAEVGTQ